MKLMQNESQFYASFTDLLALLLVFFIYLTAMNSMESISQVKQKTPLSPDDYRPVEVIESTKMLETLILKVENHVLFPTGSAELNNRAEIVLQELADVVIQTPVRLVISGHTDPNPIDRPIIESNWHLSALRAASVANFLELQGVPKSYLKIIGYAATTPDVDSNDHLNRRVEIQLEHL